MRSESTAPWCGTSASSSTRDLDRALEGGRARRPVGILVEDGPAQVLEPKCPFISDHHERLRDKGDEQDDDGDNADEHPPRVEPADVVQRRRMPDAEHEDQEAEDEPARIEGAQAEQDEDRRPADVELSAAEEGPGNVPTVQLSRGE